MAKLGWGILAAGNIARTFANGVKRSRTGQLVAVGSRTQQKADTFAKEFGGIKAHGSYEALLADKQVDAVYIATPHPQHAEWAIKAAEAGKHILCEKPIGMNAVETMAIIEAAVKNDVFLMEAFMYRCHPQTRKVWELVKEGAIGEVRVIQAAFGYHWPKPFTPDTRATNLDLGGGGILDVGCYPVSFARLVAGAALGQGFAEPLDIKALGHLGTTHVDEWTSAVLRFPKNIIAQLSTSVQVDLDNTARIFGSDGSITVPNPWVPSKEGGKTTIQLSRNGKSEDLVIESPEFLYALEADMVGDHHKERQAPSPAMNWEDTLGNMRALDRWRAQLGLVYNTEKLSPFPPTVSGRPLARAKKPKIPTAKIKGLDKPVSRLAMGLCADHNLAAALFDAYFEQGGNAFDTSWWYGQGKADKVLGGWIKSRNVRQDTVIIAKGAHTPGCYPKEVTRQLLASLEFLQTDCADIYMLHRDNPEIPVGEFVEVLNEHQRAGRIKIFGGSNWSLERVQAFNDYADKHGLKRMSVVSNNFSLARMVRPVWDGCVAAKDPEYTNYFRKTETTLLVWSSQARGFFVRGDPKDKSDGELVNSWYSADNFERLKRAQELAAKKKCTANNIALAYVLAQDFPIFALIGPLQLSELRTTLPALDVKLSPAEMKWLNLETEKLK